MHKGTKQTYLLIKFNNEMNLNKFMNIKKSLHINKQTGIQIAKLKT